MLTATLNKATYIEGNKDAIKRCPGTSLMHFYVLIEDIFKTLL